jgi:apolipoprotein D and lipocalin family protein
MRWLALIPLALSACVAFPEYRDTGVPISSIATFDTARYAGTWYEVASFPVPFQAGCRNTIATYTAAENGTFDVLNICDTDDGPDQIAGTARVDGPGRLKIRLDGVPFAADYWVLWVDTDYRTAVVGTPSGRAGWILNREPVIPADRLKAARDILAFNGYDLSQLQTTMQEAP